MLVPTKMNSRLNIGRVGPLFAGWGRSAGQFSILSLFASGEAGTWFDPSDLSTLYQDAAGTTPVTAAGQVVGLMLDKSGRGNHARQPNGPSKPILQQDGGGRWHLTFDGTDDFLVTDSIDFTGTDKMTVFVGVRKLSDAGVGMIAELSPILNSNNGAFYIAGPITTNGSNYGFSSKGTSSASNSVVGFAAPVTSILTLEADIANDISSLRVDGELGTTTAADQGAGTYGNWPLYIGRRGGASLAFNGRIYGLIVRGAISTADEIAQTEAWLDRKVGV